MPTYETFTWEVSNNTSGARKFQPLEVVFDQGYRQVAENGRMRPMDTIRVEIGPIEMTEAQAVFDFLSNRKGLPFQWTPLKPFPQTPILWTCKEFESRRQGGLILTITATFEVFGYPTT